MTHLLIIRHGEYIFNENEAPYAFGLTPQGIKQAELVRDRLYNWQTAENGWRADVLISSPLARAHETAQIIAPALNLPIVVDDDIAEWENYDGSPENNQFLSTLKEIPPFQLPLTQPYPGGPTYAEFALRACTALNRIVQEHNGKKIIIVAHGGIVEASFIYAYKLSLLAPAVMLNLDPNYTALTHWQKITTKYSELWRLVTYNDYSHLEPPA